MRPSRDVWVGLAVIAATAVAVGLLVHHPDSAGPAFRLSGRGPAGLSGLGAGLRSAGFTVRTDDRPTIPDHGLAVAVEPAGLTHDEADAWIAAVRAGAVLLLATDRPDPLTDSLGLRLGPAGGPITVTRAGRTAFPDIGAPSIGPGSGFTGLPPDAAPLISLDHAAAMAVIPLGSGSVWALADPHLIINAGVASGGLAVALPLAQVAGGGVTVDEFHHGAAPALGAVAYLPTGVKLVVAQIAVVAVLAAASAARRLGPVAMAAPPAGRSTAELVGSLALLHRAAGRRDAVTAPLSRAYRRGLGGLAGAAATPLGELEHATSDAVAVHACARIETITRSVTGGDR